MSANDHHDVTQSISSLENDNGVINNVHTNPSNDTSSPINNILDSQDYITANNRNVIDMIKEHILIDKEKNNIIVNMLEDQIDFLKQELAQRNHTNERLVATLDEVINLKKQFNPHDEINKYKLDNKLDNKTIVSTKGSESKSEERSFKCYDTSKKVTNSAASTNTKNYDDIS